MLTRLAAVIIPQYIQISNHYVVQGNQDHVICQLYLKKKTQKTLSNLGIDDNFLILIQGMYPR